MNNNLESKIIKYDIISSFLTSIIIIVTLVLVAYMFNDYWSEHERAGSIILIFTSIYRIYKTFIKPFIEIKIFKYSVDDKKVEYTNGVIIKSLTTIPIKRIQQITTETNPLLNKFELVKVNIVTTTGSHNLRRVSIDEGNQIVQTITERIHIELEEDK